MAKLSSEQSFLLSKALANHALWHDYASKANLAKDMKDRATYTELALDFHKAMDERLMSAFGMTYSEIISVAKDFQHITTGKR